MSRHLTLILGGARSGKSTHAEALANASASGGGATVLYVATAQAWDDEMAARISRHRDQRPPNWQTLEAPTQVGQAIEVACRQGGEPAVILLDCLTLLASNVIAPLPEPIDPGEAEALLLAEVDGLLWAYAQSAARWIVVTNEVGLGIVPPYPLGRVYRDALGKANQRLAAAADDVLFMVAGLPMVVKGGPR